jgi:hypothetical protein
MAHRTRLNQFALQIELARTRITWLAETTSHAGRREVVLDGCCRRISIRQLTAFDRPSARITRTQRANRQPLMAFAGRRREIRRR